MMSAPAAITMNSSAMRSASRPAVASADCGMCMVSRPKQQICPARYRDCLRFVDRRSSIVHRPDDGRWTMDDGEGLMAQTAAEVLVDVLQEWGVDTVFGLPGDGINGIMEAL